MSLNVKRSLAITFLLVGMFFMAPFATKAVNTDTVGILPANPDDKVQFSNAWFIYHLDLGQQKQDGIRVINNKKETVVVRLYAVDATTTSDGAFALMPEDAPRKDVGSWVKLAVPEIEIPASSEKTVPFTFSVPGNANVGDHAGGIIMQEVDTNNNLSGTGVRIITRVGVRIYETVPGQVQKDAEVTKFDWREAPTGIANFWKDLFDINNKTLFFMGIKNNGNVSLTPKATVEVKNIFGQTVVKLPDQEIGSVFPHEENPNSVVTWDGMPLLGRYTVNLTVKFAEGGVPDKTESLVIWAIPYKIFFLLIFLAVVLILARLIMSYFFEAAKEKMPIYTVKAGDSLAMLAEKFALPWHKIAKVNEIKQPFHISVGEKLFIPVKKSNKAIIAQMSASKALSPSLSDSAEGAKRNKNRAVIIIVAVLLIGLGAAYGVKRFRDNQMVHQQMTVPQNAQQPAPAETSQKTAGGAFKKSAVQLSIHTLPNGDPESSVRLYNRFKLEGYNVTLMSGTEKDSKYDKTTIEYNTGMKDQADGVKNDMNMDSNDQIDEVEVPGLGSDIVIYNTLDKNSFLDFQLPQQ